MGGFFSTFGASTLLDWSMVALGDDEGRLYELCLEEVWRNGVSPLFRLVVDFLLCKSGVDDRRSGFKGLDVEGVREGDGPVCGIGEP